MTESDEDYRGLAAECYDLGFGDEPFWDQAFFHDRIRRNDGVVLEIACGTGRLLVPFRRDGLVVANVATASSTYGHSILANPSTCANDVVSQYVVDGTLPPPGAVCLQDQPPFTPGPPPATR